MSARFFNKKAQKPCRRFSKCKIFILQNTDYQCVIIFYTFSAAIPALTNC